MGMKPRPPRERVKGRMATFKKRPSVQLNKSTREGIESYAGALRRLLKRAGVPKDEWNNIWNNLEDYPKADADHDIQWFTAWFTGVAEALGCNFEDLVTL